MKTRFLRDREGKVDKNYTIAEDGSYIRDKKSGDKLKNIYVDSNGYNIISITINGSKYRQIKICQLQWLAWKGVIPKGFDIHHKKFSKNKRINKKFKKNDHIDNLACMSNSKHQSLHKTGNKNWLGKHHTEEQNRKQSIAVSGEKSGMWGKHHTEEALEKMRETKLGEKNPYTTLTDNQVEEMKILNYIYHIPPKDLAEKYDISKRNINHILKGDTWNPENLPKSELIQQTIKKYKKTKKPLLS